MIFLLEISFVKQSTKATANMPKAMPTTTTCVQMPKEIDSAILLMCNDAVEQAVERLSERFGFDAAQAKEFLANESMKLVRQRGPAPKMKTKKPAGGRSESKPKRVKSGYQHYIASVRDEVVELLREDFPSGKPPQSEVIKASAQMWKELPEEERAEWKEFAVKSAEGSLAASDDECDEE